MRTIGWSIIIGGILTGVATLFHPIIIDPWSHVIRILPKTVQLFWMWDHVLMLTGLSFWLMGLAAIKPVLKLDSSSGVSAVVFLGSSYTIWFMVLMMELQTFPTLGQQVLAGSNRFLASLWSVLFSYGLFSGYGAMILAYLGIFFLSVGLPIGSRLRKWGGLCAIIGAIGILLTLILMKWGVVILAVTTMPPFVWTLLIGRTLITRSIEVLES